MSASDNSPTTRPDISLKRKHSKDDNVPVVKRTRASNQQSSSPTGAFKRSKPPTVAQFNAKVSEHLFDLRELIGTLAEDVLMSLLQANFGAAHPDLGWGLPELKARAAGDPEFISKLRALRNPNHWEQSNWAQIFPLSKFFLLCVMYS